MSYDETHNYKITAKLKLNSDWFVGKVAVFILVIIIVLSTSFFFIPGFKEKLHQGYESTLIKVYEEIVFLPSE